MIEQPETTTSTPIQQEEWVQKYPAIYGSIGDREDIPDTDQVASV